MLVYRVEHKRTKLGPYSGQHRMHGMGYAHCDEKHPSPWEDTIPVRRFIDRHNEVVHGFDSLSKLHEWFDGWANKMANKGFVVRVYEVPLGSYRRGKQVLFLRDKATWVKTLSVTKNA